MDDDDDDDDHQDDEDLISHVEGVLTLNNVCQSLKVFSFILGESCR